MSLFQTASGANPQLWLILQELLDSSHRGADGGGDADLVLAAELLLLEGVTVASQGVEAGLALGAGHHAVFFQQSAEKVDKLLILDFSRGQRS